MCVQHTVGLQNPRRFAEERNRIRRMLEHVQKKQPIELTICCGQRRTFYVPETEFGCLSLGGLKRGTAHVHPHKLQLRPDPGDRTEEATGATTHFRDVSLGGQMSERFRQLVGGKGPAIRVDRLRAPDGALIVEGFAHSALHPAPWGERGARVSEQAARGGQDAEGALRQSTGTAVRKLVSLARWVFAEGVSLMIEGREPVAVTLPRVLPAARALTKHPSARRTPGRCESPRLPARALSRSDEGARPMNPSGAHPAAVSRIQKEADASLGMGDPRDGDLPQPISGRYIAGRPSFRVRAGGACRGGRRVSIQIAGLALAAVYERKVAASLERIWENVLDWEHLPWLHRDAFVGIRNVDAGSEGWRACVLLPQPQGARPAWIEVCLDRARRRYVTRTLAGLGKGTEIWTSLDPLADRVTRVRVEFHLPESSRGQRQNSAAGAIYTKLYTRLWNEDEGMMIRRQAVLDARGAPGSQDRKPFPLGSVSSLRAGLPRLIDACGARFRIVEIDGALHAHTTMCPHLGGPLEDAAPDPQGCIVCPWHGYRFDLRTGRSAEGRRLALSTPPLVVEDANGEAALVWREA